MALKQKPSIQRIKIVQAKKQQTVTAVINAANIQQQQQTSAAFVCESWKKNVKATTTTKFVTKCYWNNMH